MFGVKFFVNGKWITIAVDDYFPCVPDGAGGWRPIFASTKAHMDQEVGVKEIWPMVRTTISLFSAFHAVGIAEFLV